MSQFIIVYSDKNELLTALRQLSVSTAYEYDVANIVSVQTSTEVLISKIAPLAVVLFIDEMRKPKEEVAVSNLDMSTNKVNIIHQRFPLYNGQGLTVSVKENRPDTADIDFKGRIIPSSTTSATLSGHATIMSTIIAGGGNSYYQGKGVATGASITSTTFANLLPEPDSYYQQNNITVQNHSYGTGIENYYGADAMAYDASVITRPSLLHVFSAGNSGTSASTTGTYSGISGYANLTGSFKMAKNIITVGHTDSFMNVLPLSSRGPAYDGRIKPDLVAFGEDGSSGAAAIVSGIALALQHAYQALNGSLPSSALIRSVLLNSADDVYATNVDYTTGYGSVNAYKAMEGMVNSRYFQSSVTQGAVNEHNITVPVALGKLKVMLVWNDPPATTNAAKALVNDLDVELYSPSFNETWQPNVLFRYPHPDSLQLLAVRKRDSLNTTEQVVLYNVPPGNYIIRVRGYSITGSASQSYAVSYQMDSADVFHWQYPTGTDNLQSGTTNVIRWQNSLPNTAGQLQYTLDQGNSWQLINSNVLLATGYYKWMAPDTFSTAQLRMTIVNQPVKTTDVFTISKRIITGIGFNCPDSFSFYWNRPKDVSHFQVYKLGARYLEPLLITADTIVVLSKTANTSLHYTVAPVLNSKTGLKSYTFNYTSQGVACYISSFLAVLSGNTAQLSLSLGTLYNIRRIDFEKSGPAGFRAINTITPVTSLSLSYTDLQLTQGVNSYRVKIELTDGRIIYSDIQLIYYAGQSAYVIYPNPVVQGQSLFIVPASINQSIQLQVINSAGQKVHETAVDDVPVTIATGKLSKGLYLLRFVKEDGTVVTQKMIVK